TGATARRDRARTRPWTKIGIAALLVGIPIVVVPLFFAGSPDRLAAGTRIAGVDVGGLTPRAATHLLESRFRSGGSKPVTFGGGGVRGGGQGFPGPAVVVGGRRRRARRRRRRTAPGGWARRLPGLPPDPARALPAGRPPAGARLRPGRRLRARRARPRCRRAA